jgi:26S proteasome regulatory subunit T5
MSTLEDLDDLEREDKDKKTDQRDGDGGKLDKDGDADMKDADADKKKDEDELLDDEILRSSTRDIIKRRRMLENELRIMKSEFQRLTHEQTTMKDKVKDNSEKIENNRYRAFHLPRANLLNA